MSTIWTPVPEGPHENFVERVNRAIADFAGAHGVEAPGVEVELADGARFVVLRIDPDPGNGMVTLHVQSDDDEGPEALLVPLGTIRRIELRKTLPEHMQFGFSIRPS